MGQIYIQFARHGLTLRCIDGKGFEEVWNGLARHALGAAQSPLVHHHFSETTLTYFGTFSDTPSNFSTYGILVKFHKGRTTANHLHSVKIQPFKVLSKCTPLKDLQRRLRQPMDSLNVLIGKAPILQCLGTGTSSHGTMIFLNEVGCKSTNQNLSFSCTGTKSKGTRLVPKVA